MSERRTMPAEEAGILKDIGQRLNAYRLAHGLSPEMLADRLGVSRAALYRAEKGEILKIETLVRISRVLDVSLPNLLGVGIEYVDTALGFFERMRQIEAESEQIIGFFGPLSYLLTSSAYDEMLALAMDDLRSKDDETATAIDRLLSVLRQRKEAYQRRRPLLVNLIAASELRRFLSNGLIGRDDLSASDRRNRQSMARAEVKHIVELVKKPSIGVQIAVVPGLVPATNFQIFRQAGRSVLAISPFRLGEQPNVRVGVGIITASLEGVKLHEEIARRMWESALKGEDAIDLISSMMAETRH
ncbi:DNA-binding helix-turn-helix protein (plasmid) [Neorhizobium galegae bv. officinalis bv. officinalis str. HAMBI 1141]|uniref:DNA-binding helix-turn-helix protein n=2 Tax=Neorhizobium galegae TaxID=399 RepID=A0A068TGA8_NEOGA|nr:MULTISPECIES: helix-turn-helix transcriptional regulator [unclassified Neorhizobium]MCJ9669601.1 helix-turn-helix domain-containing protein [Neorhizobium sp. SHOUNA12B]MCJ9745978.1 helix-turn-helix domain-containing protein [Neorhizobium sp. SHOUNA12A]CDN57482.1 DNA-binding helix-turn-helix protein [Neorhizobium galegae bv. officinalis bv. officinalis str. HAMBI 1141]